MMQDAVLTMCRDSVKEFVKFVLAFCPLETVVTSTRMVSNTFDKKILTPEDSDYEEMPF